jgi:hypothetical protein
MTVTARYQLASGDSLVRATYYTDKQFAAPFRRAVDHDARTRK